MVPVLQKNIRYIYIFTVSIYTRIYKYLSEATTSSLYAGHYNVQNSPEKPSCQKITLGTIYAVVLDTIWGKITNIYPVPVPKLSFIPENGTALANANP